MVVDIAALVVGLALLGWSADKFVVSAARLARAVNVSPLVIGTVLVGFGTGTPELLVSGLAAGQGDAAIGVGNIVGSNLANLTLVLGVAALITPADVVPRVLRREAPISLAAVAVFAVLVQNGLGVAEGVVLLIALVVATAALLRSATPPPAELREPASRELAHEVEELEEVDERPPPIRTRHEVLVALGGLVGVLIGAQLLVSAARGIAAEIGLSGGFVGLTIVAVGTSLPELVTGIQSMRRGESSLLIGNVLGSNLFNSLGVGGVVAVVGPKALTDPGLTVVAVIVMVVVAVLATAFLTGGAVKRWEAATLLVVYLATLPLMA